MRPHLAFSEASQAEVKAPDELGTGSGVDTGPKDETRNEGESEVSAYLMVWLLPGAVLCVSQGLAQWSGVHTPQIIVYGHELPRWVTYSLVLVLGPFLLLAMLSDIITNKRGY